MKNLYLILVVLCFMGGMILSKTLQGRGERTTYY